MQPEVADRVASWKTLEPEQMTKIEMVVQHSVVLRQTATALRLEKEKQSRGSNSYNWLRVRGLGFEACRNCDWSCQTSVHMSSQYILPFHHVALLDT